MTIMTTFSYSYSMSSLSKFIENNIRLTKRVLVLVN